MGRPIVRDVFLVEDEALIRMMIVEMVEELSRRVIAEAGNVEDTQLLAVSARFDLAILDINIRGTAIFPIAEILLERQLPFIFAGGYGATGLPEPFRLHTVLRKPFMIEQLAMAIETIVTRP